MTMMVQSNGVAHAPEGRAVDASIIERVMAVGDLSRLQPAERVSYYVAVCRSVGLNPLTKPFDYINLNGKLTLYSTKNATDQLRQIHSVSVDGLKRETVEGVHVVTANVSTKDGRRDEDVGAVSIAGLRGEALANALMKATTKAKRRATLSICGLSFVDESEIEAIPEARRVTVTEDGEIVDPPKRLAPPANPATVVAKVVFGELCARIDATERKVGLNKIAADAKRALADGAISDGEYKSLAKACNNKAALLSGTAVPPSAPAMDDSAGGDTAYEGAFDQEGS
jgi:hypothetical protein